MASKILVVDDEATIRSFFEVLLTRSGYQVITAEDGVTGLACFEEHLPDLVITDIYMPRKNGLELITEIRAMCPQQRIVAMAAIIGSAHQEAIAAGADDTLQKPFGVADLLEKIATWLETSPPN